MYQASDETMQSMVLAFTKMQDGIQGPAERSGKIRVGDHLTSIGDTTLASIAEEHENLDAWFGQVIKTIVDAPRPIRLGFVRGLPFDTNLLTDSSQASEGWVHMLAPEDKLFSAPGVSRSRAQKRFVRIQGSNLFYFKP